MNRLDPNIISERTLHLEIGTRFPVGIWYTDRKHCRTETLNDSPRQISVVIINLRYREDFVNCPDKISDDFVFI